MSLFNPIDGLLGGSLIGLAASTLLLGNGDILGFSGIVSSVVLNPRQAFASKNRWKIVFLSSFLVTSTIVGTFLVPESIASGGAEELKSIQGYPISNVGYALAGFLVGFGSRLGNGCTSGHGICGLARLSIRSFTAVVTFMATAISTTTFILPMSSGFLLTSTMGGDTVYPTDNSRLFSNVVTTVAGIVSIPLLFKKSRQVMDQKNKEAILEQKEMAVNQRKLPVAAIAASIFSVGLAVSGMIQQRKILGFLDMKGISGGYWDGTLILVMGGGLVVSAAGYHWVEGFNYFKNDKVLSCPLIGDKACGKFNIPRNKKVDAQLVLGAACFGIGWGLGGLCPAPALFVAASGYPKVLLYWWPFNFLGVFIAEYAKKIF